MRNHRGSPLKARLVADAIRGKRVSDALEVLTFSTKRAATNIQKALTAAYAEAELADVDDGRLYVVESRVDEGPHIKRFRPKDRGRAHPILKRTSHITISIEERS
ncbi:MAG: 50S ribosomal protein L22 [Planctomycetota bacterium]